MCTLKVVLLQTQNRKWSKILILNLLMLLCSLSSQDSCSFQKLKQERGKREREFIGDRRDIYCGEIKMGRGKIEIKRIENSSNRNVTYSKRRKGIIKKAKEITVLCDAKVSLIIHASSGKMVEYCSGPQETLLEILDRYHSQTGKKLWDAKHENLSNELNKIKKENDGMQVQFRHLKGEDITSLNHIELGELEEALENGLASIRDKQSEFVEMIRENDKALEEENERLNYELHNQTIKTEENLRDIEYRQRMSQMPFTFMLAQSIQPNLPDGHDRE